MTFCQWKIIMGKLRQKHLFTILCRITPLTVAFCWVLLLFFPKFVFADNPKANTRAVSDPYLIFMKHYELTGGLERWKGVVSTYSNGSVIYDGLAGQFEAFYQKSMRFHLIEDFGVIKYTQGDSGETSWSQDTNGKVLINKDEETLKRRELKRRYEDFEHLNRKSKIFVLSCVGEQIVGNTVCLVVRVTNKINKDIEWYFFDNKTFCLIKTIEKQPDIEIHTQYADFRCVYDFIVPFYTSTYIFPRDKIEITQVEQYAVNPQFDKEIFAIPPDVQDDFVFEQNKNEVTLGFLFEDDAIFLPVRIGQDTRLWQLDTGASGSVIDEDYARWLGIAPEGEIKGFGFGDNFHLSFVKIPQHCVDGLCLKEQTILAFKGVADNSYEPTMYGILGYDFLSRFVTRIDYANQSITFYDKASFSYKGNGIIIDAPLKNNTFTVPVVVDKRLKGRWSLDVGATDASFYFKYAKKHGLLPKKGITGAKRGMGGVFLQKKVRFDEFVFEGVGGGVSHRLRLDSPVFSIPLSHNVSSIGELVGNLGNSILKHFVLYLDYDKQQIILEPGKWFNLSFKQDLSGITVGLSEQGEPMISYLDPKAYASRQGFREGDVFVAINNAPLSQVNGVRSVKKILMERTSKPLKITVRRGDSLLDLSL